jgi:hypothetical protein
MNCKLHDKPKEIVCARCADAVCPKCAEYIDGSWFCPQCAIRERGIAAGLDYFALVGAGTGEPAYVDEVVEPDNGEL